MFDIFSLNCNNVKRELVFTVDKLEAALWYRNWLSRSRDRHIGVQSLFPHAAHAARITAPSINLIRCTLIWSVQHVSWIVKSLTNSQQSPFHVLQMRVENRCSGIICSVLHMPIGCVQLLPVSNVYVTCNATLRITNTSVDEIFCCLTQNSLLIIVLGCIYISIMT